MRHVLRLIFWYAPIPLQVVLLTTMLIRRLYRQLPYFFSYTTLILLQVALLLPLGRESRLYANVYWFGQLISWALGLAIIYEIYATMLREYAVLRKIGIGLFWVTGCGLLLVAAWTAYHTPGADVNRLLKGLLTLERSVRIVQCGLLLTLFIFASFFGLSWKDLPFGIALGFAVYVCTELAVVAIRAYTGYTQVPFYRYLNPASWDVALIIWTFYVVKRWRPVKLHTLPKNDLASWNDTLRDLLHR